MYKYKYMYMYLGKMGKRAGAIGAQPPDQLENDMISSRTRDARTRDKWLNGSEPTPRQYGMFYFLYI